MAEPTPEGLVRGGAVAAKLYVQAAMQEARTACKIALAALDAAERKYVRDLEGDAPYGLLLATLTDREKATALKAAVADGQAPAEQPLHTQRVTCPACGKNVALRSDGLVRNHDVPGGRQAGRCPGSRAKLTTAPAAKSGRPQLSELARASHEAGRAEALAELEEIWALDQGPGGMVPLDTQTAANLRLPKIRARLRRARRTPWEPAEVPDG